VNAIAIVVSNCRIVETSNRDNVRYIELSEFGHSIRILVCLLSIVRLFDCDKIGVLD
jgi:hypothetical protein